MKKLLLFSGIILLVLSAHSQICIPDTNYTEPGIYPKDSILPQAEVNVLYEQTLTIIVPKDTTATVFNQNQVVLIDSIQLFKTIGFPDWLSIICDSSCGYPGGDTGCAVLMGTPPDSIADTTYSLGFITKTFARLQALPSFTIEQNDTVEAYWSLTLNNPLISGTQKLIENKALTQVNYNQNQIYLSGFNYEAGQNTLRIINMTGQIIHIDSWYATKGQFYQSIPMPSVSAGIYFIKLENKTRREVKKILIH